MVKIVKHSSWCAESAQAVPVQAHTRAARSSQGDMLRGSSVPAQEHRRNSTHTVKEDVDMQVSQALPASGPCCINHGTTVQLLHHSLPLLRAYL